MQNTGDYNLIQLEGDLSENQWEMKTFRCELTTSL